MMASKFTAWWLRNRRACVGVKQLWWVNGGQRDAWLDRKIIKKSGIISVAGSLYISNGMAW
jgi:hypothetical protein